MDARTLRHRTRCRRLVALALLASLAGACGDPAPAGPPRARAGAPRPTADWLVDITAQVGVDFVHTTGLDGSFAMPQIVGSGGALFDYDNDGDLDLYLVNSTHGDPSARPNALYRQDADGRFREVAAQAGVADRGFGMGATVGDYDNDGDLDLLVTNYGRDSLYRNDGDGTFTDVTEAAGLRAEAWSTSASFFDYDADGFLDLYIATYVNHDPKKVCRDQSGRLEYCGPQAFPGTPDLLYHNRGDGTFEEVAAKAGTLSTAGKGLGLVTADFDDDGWQDVFVANDGVSNQLWINSGHGTFEDHALGTGVAVNSKGKPEASMGVALGDANGDLDLDLFVTHLDRETNTLYTTLDMRMFQDCTARAGLGADSVPKTGFGTGFLDLEDDGDLDLLIVNGRVARVREEGEGGADAMAGYRQTNDLILNDGAGRFAYRCDAVASFSGAQDVSRGLMLGDIDRDGDLDVVVTNCNGPARLYRNDAPRAGRWVAVRAIDGERRRDAVGARVYVQAGGRWWVRPVTHAYSYLVGGDATAHFGLGQAEAVERIVVRWPDGSHEGFPGVAVDRVTSVVRGDGTPARSPRERK